MIAAFPKAKSSTISAVVTRADGRVEDLGLIAYWHKNPLLRLAGKLYIWIKERLRP